MQVELVVFDIAGTTLEDNDAVNHCFRAALGEAGLTAPHALINSVMGLPKPLAVRQIVEQVGGANKDRYLEKIDQIHEDFVRRMIAYYSNDPDVSEVPQIAINTGFSRDITQAIIDRLGWARKIDFSVCSDEVSRGRPHSDMILAAMKKFKISDPKVVCKVGDTPSDLQEGTAAGCGWVVGVTKGSHTREQLEPYPHTHLIETVAELPVLLGL
jgi:phosphonatase-like hydrolase